MKQILLVGLLSFCGSVSTAQARNVCISASAPCVTSTSPATLTGHVQGFTAPVFEWQKQDGGTWIGVGSNSAVYVAIESGMYRLRVIETGSACYQYSNELCIGTCTVVPVVFTTFLASTTDRTTTIRWTTEGADSLVLQRSDNGAIFTDIASVPTSGTRQEPARTAQYRLKAVSVDGKMAYSEIVAVKKDINFDQPVAIQIIMMNGARVFSGVRTFANEAVLTQFVSRIVPSGGVYCVQIQQGNCTRSVLFQK